MDKSLEQIFEEYKDMVRAKAGLYFMMGAEKEDLIQEGMIGLVKAYNSYDPSRGASFGTYADICVNRQMISAVQSASRQKNQPLNSAVYLDSRVNDQEDSPTVGETLLAGADASPEDQVLYSELLELLANPPEAVFSPLEQSVLKLLVNGQKYKEIAENLGKSPKQIDNAIQRIRKKIRNII